jgi:hypothetical protein
MKFCCLHVDKGSIPFTSTSSGLKTFGTYADAKTHLDNGT